MEYCSPLWAGPPASHLSPLHVVETKAFRIIGTSCDEAESLGFSLSHRRQVGGLCLLPSPLRMSPPPPPPPPPYLRRALKDHQKLSSGETTKIKNHCSPSLFHSSFFQPLEQTSTHPNPTPPPGLQNSCSPPSLIFPHPKP